MLRTIGLALLIALVIVALGCAGGSGSGSLSHPGGPALGNATSVVVTPANTKVFESEMAQFQATVVGETDQAVMWSVVESSGGTINGAGLYTAPKQVSGRQPFHIVATSRAVPTASG